MRHIISGIVISGQKKGELIKVPIASVSNMILSLVECTIFRVTILDRKSADDILDALRLFVARLKA